MIALAACLRATIVNEGDGSDDALSSGIVADQFGSPNVGFYRLISVLCIKRAKFKT